MGNEIDTAVVEKLHQSFESQKQAIEAQSAKLEEVSSAVTGIPEAFRKAMEETPKNDPEDKAKLEKNGPLEGVSKFEVWDIPVGQALVGGFVAVFAGELIDSFLAAQSGYVKGAVKLIGAGAAIKWGPRLFGDTGSKAIAILLAYDGIRSLIPIDEWAGRASGVIRTRTGAGLAGKAGMDIPSNGKKPIMGDYYAGLHGGGR